MLTRVAFVLALLVLICHYATALSAPEGVYCMEEEKNALLDFKLSFTADPKGALSTWSTDNPECCFWSGVVCDYDTWHVKSIDIAHSSLESHQLRPSLLVLQHLAELDLSDNYFTMRIPEFIGSLTNLTTLDLSLSGFYGKIPPCLGNLTSLQQLDLGSVSLSYYRDSSYNLLYADNLQWLSHLSALQYLSLGGANLSSATDWVSTLKMLPSLLRFRCSSCSLPLIPPQVSALCLLNRSTSLEFLDLSNNSISPLSFSYLINGSVNLNSLTLTSMITEQDVYEYLESLAQDCSCTQKLEYLYIPHNVMSKLPNLSKFSSLIRLDASFNGIQGNLHSLLQHLPTNLTKLVLSSNSLNDVVSDSYFSKFVKLQELDLSNNYLLRFNFSQSWVPQSQLKILTLGSCKLGPKFPNWIFNLTYLVTLDISNSSIFDDIPTAFPNLINKLLFLNVSNNKLHGTFPNLQIEPKRESYSVVDLSFNDFHGPIPIFIFLAFGLDLSHNKFTGFYPRHEVSSHYLMIINLSNNLLSGSLPDWIFHFHGLEVINLSYNKLSGIIPSSIASSWKLSAFHLNSNRFYGELPSSMKNCTHLTILELGNNNFSGTVPSWLGKSLNHLIVLNLRSNHFIGELPSNLCNLQRLQLLDLSRNRISGSIPGCVDNLTSMAMDQGFNVSSSGGFSLSYTVVDGQYEQVDYASVLWKGILANESGTHLPQWNVIDLSNNRLTGVIPSGFTSLKYLKSLDLSNNSLNGSIPDKIGHLKYLEVLKLSSNRLHGEIPQSLADLTFLNTLNLSSNNLRGEIPKSTQLQSLDPSSYGGNPELCGEPLPTKCPWDKDDVKSQPSVRDIPKDEEEEEGPETFDFEAFYGALGTGFAFGLLGILGILNFHAPFRHAFFHAASEFGDWIFLRTFLCMYSIKRTLCF